MYDPKRKAISVELDPERQFKLVAYECGHTGKHNPFYDIPPGDMVPCFACGEAERAARLDHSESAVANSVDAQAYRTGRGARQAGKPISFNFYPAGSSAWHEFRLGWADGTAPFVKPRCC
jgi:hypothetical protein